MRVRWLFMQLVNLLFLTEWTLCGVVKVLVSGPLVLQDAAGGVWGEEAGRQVRLVPHGRRLLAASAASSSATPGRASPSSAPPVTPSTTQQQRQQQQQQQRKVEHHPVGIPHMWSERQHNQRSHSHQEVPVHHGGGSSQHVDHVASPQGGGAGGVGVVALQEPTGETHTLTYDHVQEGASHSGKPAVTRQDRRKEQLAQLKKQLHRTGGINDILKRPGVDPEITGDANLNMLSVMRLASMNLSELISIDDDVNNNNHTGSGNLTARQLRRKLRRRLSNKDVARSHGRSRYSLVTTRIRTRAKRSDGDMNDDYTWAVIVGGSGLAILIVVLCACVCARCNVDQKGTEALTPLPPDPPTPAVFFVGGNNSADTGVDNSGFAMGDIPLGCGGAEAAGGAGASTSCFGYSALKDDDDCVSLKSANLELEKS